VHVRGSGHLIVALTWVGYANSVMRSGAALRPKVRPKPTAGEEFTGERSFEPEMCEKRTHSPGSDERLNVLSCGLEYRTGEHDARADEESRSSAEVVRYVWRDGEGLYTFDAGTRQYTRRLVHTTIEPMTCAALMRPSFVPLGSLKYCCQAGRICSPDKEESQENSGDRTRRRCVPLTRDESNPLIGAVRRGRKRYKFKYRMPTRHDVRT
jgi:hypothetical protein